MAGLLSKFYITASAAAALACCCFPVGQASEASGSPRIISFAPSNTELVYSLGAQNELVGVCSYCDYPPEAKKEPQVGSFVSANMERLVRLHPDLILLVSGQEALRSTLEHQGFKVKMLNNDRIFELPGNLRQLGRLTGKEQEADRLAQQVDKSLSQLTRLVKKSKPPNVFVCIWPQPLLTIGKASFLNDIITVCGGTNMSGNLPSAYPHFSPERLIVDNPDILILPHESIDSGLDKRPPWSALKAVHDHRLFYLPTAQDDHLARPSLRIFEGILWLSQRLHPELKAELESWYANTQSSLSHGTTESAHPELHRSRSKGQISGR